MPYPSDPPWLGHSNYTWRRVRAMKLLVMQLSPPSRHSIPLRSKYSPQHPVLKHPQSLYLPKWQRPSLKPTRNKRPWYSLLHSKCHIFRQQTRWQKVMDRMEPIINKELEEWRLLRCYAVWILSHDVSEELSASIIRMTRIGELGTLQRTPSSTRCQVSRVAPRQETCLAQTHIHRTEATENDAHQNALATWTEVETLHKQQNSHIQSNTQSNLDLWNTAVGYGFHFEHRNHRTLPI
jgi:hypothetical protein